MEGPGTSKVEISEQPGAVPTASPKAIEPFGLTIRLGFIAIFHGWESDPPTIVAA